MARSPRSKNPAPDLLELDLDALTDDDSDEEALFDAPPTDEPADEPVDSEIEGGTSGSTKGSRRAISNGGERRENAANPALLPTMPGVFPLVPIRDNVYFPHMLFPLFIGRDRSVKAVETAMEQGERFILLAAQRQVMTEDPEPEDIYTVGVIAEVTQLLKMPDNAIRVVLEAGERVRLAQYLQTAPYMLVRTEPLEPIPDEAPLEVEGLLRLAVQQFEKLVSESKNIPPEALVSVMNLAEPDHVADAVIPYLNLRVDQKQELLETLPVRERLEKLIAILHREQEILEVQKSIRSRVETEMGDHQREFLLREQMKAIQQELGEMGERDEVAEYREKIEAAGMPEEVAERALKELDRFEKTPPASPEAGVLRNYLDWLVAMPWSVATEERLDMAEAEESLQADHYGLEKVKERILEFLAVRKLSGGSRKSPILCFVGPPGVGKTSLGRSVAKALSRKFTRVSLGGVRDEAEIRGHRRTYVGAMPGRIIQAIKQCGCKNPVFLLDEIDKMGHDFRGDPSSALLEALDPEQNSEFSDHFLEVPFDLSDVLFVTTANLLETIPGPLRDRMEVISFSGYTEAEKLAIAERYLGPKQIEANGLTPEQIAFERDAFRRLIREYTREAGVRNLEREIGAVCRKVARKVAAGETDAVVVRAEDLSTYLGGRRYQWGVAEEHDEVGAATGLVYTESGGDTVAVEAILTRAIGSEGRLTLTGQLGEVMKESALTAWTFVRSRLAALGLPEEAGSRQDVHVHVPAGAVPKDGPSAGVTMATALASALAGRPVRKDIAMTGEITLRGKVLPVGGIKEKVLAAHRAGIREVLLPAENEKDLEDIPAEIRGEMRFDLMTHADEILKIALLGGAERNGNGAEPVATNGSDHAETAEKPAAPSKVRRKQAVTGTLTE
ncbi:MAG: endopeptidase La [Armatimonadaceae bacterium]